MSRKNDKPQKKLRGIPRRLRAMKKGLVSVATCFPSESSFHSPGYWNYKIPVDWALVEGRQATLTIKREVALQLIQACHALIEVKPQWASSYRVTCNICLPDMHASEICIYSSETYFRLKCGELNNSLGRQTMIANPSLSSEWQLELPKGMSELGIRWQYDTSPDPDEHYVSDHWVYGEVK